MTGYERKKIGMLETESKKKGKSVWKKRTDGRVPAGKRGRKRERKGKR